MSEYGSGLNLAGQTFGRLTVIERAPWSLSGPSWICKCACGNTTDATTYQLTHGKRKSCGCIGRGVKL